ncbi:hypothetical protein PROFUN_03391 [Planoprotostelium fungivorum]|uniref:EGF-like domain-containing protein n=1 Tax=Planoprotostelium fungivorum TaxID=1890364 RepID=A0A2P6NWE2_9EUKA|nr:hypothetical protein PROFUN_03391 [Planoprotostelium fungivorum]
MHSDLNVLGMNAVWILALSLCLLPAVSGDCNITCHNYGRCLSETMGGNITYYCDCSYYYEGEFCLDPWRSDASFMKYMNVYTSFTVVTNGALLFWILYEIWKSGVARWTKYSVVTFSIFLIALGSLAYTVLYDLPFIVWFSAGFGLAVYWMELVQMTQSLGDHIINKYRIVTRILIATVYILLVPSAIYLSVYPESLAALVLYDVFFLLLLLIFLFLTLLFGIKLIRLISDDVQYENLRIFLRRIIYHMISVVIIYVFAVISLIVFLFRGRNKWWYIGIHWTIRVEELVVCLSVLYIFSRKRPPSRSHLSKDRGDTVAVPINTRPDHAKMKLEVHDPPPAV